MHPKSMRAGCACLIKLRVFLSEHDIGCITVESYHVNVYFYSVVHSMHSNRFCPVARLQIGISKMRVFTSLQCGRRGRGRRVRVSSAASD